MKYDCFGGRAGALFLFFFLIISKIKDKFVRRRVKNEV